MPHGASLFALLATQVCAGNGDGVRRYGGGTAGSGNIEPTLWASETPRPGNPRFKLRVERSLGGTWAFPFLSQRRADFQYGGVRFLLDTTDAVYYGAYFLPGQGDGGGQGDVAFPLPNNRELLGQAVYVQAFTLDDFAPNPLGFGATAGLRLELQAPAQILVSRTTSATPSPQTAIDLASGTSADFDNTQIDHGRGAAFVQQGTIGVVVDAAAGRLRIYDTTVFPPAWTGNAALVGSGEPIRIVPAPDGARAYVIPTGDAGTSPPIVAYDVRAGANFGRAWPGPPIRLELVPDACGMVFTSDGTTAFVVAAGPRSGGEASVTRVDVDPTSPTFHQHTGILTFPGREASGIAIAADDRTLYVPLATATGAEIAVVDVRTFLARDMDPGTPGVQSLGAEQSMTRTLLPRRLGQVVVDPRSELLYCATRGGVVRIDVAPASPTFRRVVALGDKIDAQEPVVALALADAGEALYVAAEGLVTEYDTRTLQATRTWSLTGIVDITLR